MALLLLAWAPPARAQEDCFDNAFCLEGVRGQDGEISIRIKNLLPGNLTMRLDMELENMRAGRRLPMVLTIPGARTVQPLQLEIRDEFERWGYRFDAQWMMGTLNPRHEPTASYTLPFDAGTTRLVGQGYNGTTTHQGKYALDFEMPEGTPVRAAREGIVIETEDSFREGGPDQALKTRANFVKVQHEDGTIANYVHLQHQGVRVRAGQPVGRGDLLGLSGNTGFTTGPHLHFEVYGISADLDRDTIPVQFLTSDGPARLVEGRSYVNTHARGVPTSRPRGW